VVRNNKTENVTCRMESGTSDIPLHLNETVDMTAIHSPGDPLPPAGLFPPSVHALLLVPEGRSGQEDPETREKWI